MTYEPPVNPYLDKDIWYEVETLPVRYDLGFPQQLSINLEGLAYTIIYRFNDYDDSLILTVIREIDEGVMFNGKVVNLNPILLQEADYSARYALLPVYVQRDIIQIIIVYAPRVGDTEEE